MLPPTADTPVAPSLSPPARATTRDGASPHSASAQGAVAHGSVAHGAVARSASPRAGGGASGTSFVFFGDRLWLDFVNTDDTRRADTPHRGDVLRDFDVFIDWLQSAAALDAERAAGLRRRAFQQPAGAAAALVDARRVRVALRALAERGLQSAAARADALVEINRILGRSAGTRRVEQRADGSYARTFVSVGDAFAGLMLPVVDSAADSLIAGELARVRRCSDPRCSHVFLDTTKNGRRRWCDMATCGNRAKAARHRRRAHRARDGSDGLTVSS